MKNRTAQRKQLRESEAIKYESLKKKSEKCQEDLRLAIIDHAITGQKREPPKIGKLRTKLEQMEHTQDSQKALVANYCKLSQW